jgi:hypothetical protein
VIAVLRVEGRVTLQPSVAIRDDDFCVWVRRKRLYLVSVHGAAGGMIDKFGEVGRGSVEIGPQYLVTRKSNQPFDEKLSAFLR